jgi:hypothetical protein
MPLLINCWRTVAMAVASTPSGGCDVAGLMRAWAEFHHRAKIFLLQDGQSVEANSEEVGV